MAQFHVYRVGAELILDCQSDLLSDLPTRFIIPLEPLATAPRGATRLNPILSLDGEQLMMLTGYAGAVPRRALTESVGSRAGSDLAIKNALDLLVSDV